MNKRSSNASNPASIRTFAKKAYWFLFSLLLTCALFWPGLNTQATNVFWVSGCSLMPGTRGFYPNGSDYGGTIPLDPEGAAWASGGASITHVLTWVVNIPTSATYYVWTRGYGGYGGLNASVNEVIVAGGARQVGSGGQYVWREKGCTAIAQGTNHIDLAVNWGMFDAVLLTTDPAFVPDLNGSNLPPRIANPVLRAPRNYYRSDSNLMALAGNQGYVAAALPALYGEPYNMPLNDFVPATNQVINDLALWSARNQYVSATFAVRGLTAATQFNLSLGGLVGPTGATIATNEIDLKVVKSMLKKLSINNVVSPDGELLPELLLRDDRTTIPPTGAQGGYGGGSCVCSLPAHESRQFWLTVHVASNMPAGVYTGAIAMVVSGQPSRTLTFPISVTVYPINLQTVEGNYNIFQWYTSAQLGDSVYREMLRDQARHGLNGTTLYAGFPDFTNVVASGMSGGYPIDMGWPSNYQDPLTNVAQAASAGFEDYIYWIMDEPEPSEIQACLAALDQAASYPVRASVSINDGYIWNALKDYVTAPILNLYVFWSGTAAAYAKTNGFLPSSYWVTADTDSIYCRAYAGLYNASRGFLGCVPWAYADYWDTNGYSSTTTPSMACYPDENGMPISTIRWEAYKDGIDDMRYLQEMDRLIAAAQAHLSETNPTAILTNAIGYAQNVRATYYEPLCCAFAYYNYLNWIPENQLDTVRLAFANAILQLNSPMASAGTLTVSEDVPATGTLVGLDLDGDSLAYSIVANGSKGTAAITDASTGAYIYTPNAAAIGQDTFSFKCTGSGVDSAPATVTVTINRAAPTNGLYLWVKANTGVTLDAGTNVAGWADQSGNGNNLTNAYSEFRPSRTLNALNGQPVIYFKGDTLYSTFIYNLNLNLDQSAYSIIVVRSFPYTIYNYASSIKFAITLAKTSADSSSGPTLVAWQDWFNYWTPDYASYKSFGPSTTTLDTYNLTSIVMSGANGAIYNKTGGYSDTLKGNLTQASTGTLSRVCINRGLTAGGVDSWAYAAHQNIAELLIYNRALDASERTALVQYLSDKYGL